MASRHVVEIMVRGIDEATKVFQTVNRSADRALKQVGDAVKSVPDIDIDTDIDTADARLKMSRLESDIRRVPDVDVDADMDSRRINRELNNVEKSIDRMPDVDVDADMDSREINRKLDNVEKQIKGMPDVEVETKRATRELDNLDRSSRRASIGVMDLVKALGLVGLAHKTISMVRNSFDSAFRRIDAFENFHSVMTTLTGSSETAQRILDKVNDTVRGTAYSLDVAAKAVQDFVTRGVDVDRATRYVEAFGDAVAFYGDGSNEQFANVQDALAKMMTTGKVQMDQMNRLFDAGIDAVGMYAKATGKDAEAVQKALSKGEISAQEFLDTVSKAMMEGTNGVVKIAGSAKEGGATWSSVIGNMQTAIARGVANVIQSIDKMLTDNGLPDMRSMIASFGTAFEGMLNRVASLIENVDFGKLVATVKALTSAFSGLVAGLVAFSVLSSVVSAFKTLRTLMIAYRAGTLKATMAQLGFNVAVLTSPVTWIAVAIGALIAVIVALALNWESVSSTLEGSWASLGSLAENVFGGMKDLFSGLFDNVGPKASEMVAKVQEALSSLAGSDFGEKIAEQFSGITNAISGAISGDLDGIISMFANLLPSIIGFLVGGIPGLVITASKYMPAIAEGLERHATRVMEVIVQVVENMVTFITTYLPVFVEKGVEVLTTLINGMLEAVPYVMPVIVNLITFLLTVIAENLPYVLDAGISILMAMVDGILSSLPIILDSGLQILMALIEGIVAMLPHLIETAVTLILMFIESILSMLPQIIEAGLNVLLALIDGIIAVLPQLIETAMVLIMSLSMAIIANLPKIIEAGIKILFSLIAGIIRVLPELLMAGLELILQLAWTILKNLPTILKAGVEILWALIKGIVSMIPELLVMIGKLFIELIATILGKVPDFLDAGKELIKGLWNGIKSVKDWILKKIKGFVGDITGGIKKFFGIKSPSVLMEVEVGKFLPLGLIEGVMGMKGQVMKAMDKVNEWLIPDVPEVAVGFAGVSGGQINYEKPTIRSYGSNGDVSRGKLKEIIEDVVGTLIDKLNGGGNGEDSPDSEQPTVIEIPVNIDGREVARVTAPYMDRELGKKRIDRTRAEGEQNVYL